MAIEVMCHHRKEIRSCNLHYTHWTGVHVYTN